MQRISIVALLFLPFLILSVSNTTSQEIPKFWENAKLTYTLKPFGEIQPESTCLGFSIYDRAISPDSQILAVSVNGFVDKLCGGGKSNLTLWNLQTGKQISTLVDGYADIGEIAEDRNQEPDDFDALVGNIARSLAFTPDSKILAAGMSDATIKLWNGKTGQLLRTLTGHKYAVRAITILPDGQTLISSSSDKSIKFWNLQSGQLIRTLTSSQNVYSLIVSPDRQSLVSFTAPNYYTWLNPSSFNLDNGSVQLWDIDRGKIVRTFSYSKDLANPVLFGQDSQILISGSNDNTIKLWNARTGARILSLTSHSGKIRSLALTPDDLFLASSSEDGTVKLWNFKTRHLIRTIENLDAYEVAFSADGKTLIVDTDGYRELWNWRLPKKMMVLDRDPNSIVTPDGKTLINVDAKNYAIEVWR
jgi:WD40 repeat protein